MNYSDSGRSDPHERCTGALYPLLRIVSLSSFLCCLRRSREERRREKGGGGQQRLTESESEPRNYIKRRRRRSQSEREIMNRRKKARNRKREGNVMGVGWRGRWGAERQPRARYAVHGGGSSFS